MSFLSKAWGNKIIRDVKEIHCIHIDHIDQVNPSWSRKGKNVNGRERNVERKEISSVAVTISTGDFTIGDLSDWFIKSTDDHLSRFGDDDSSRWTLGGKLMS